MLCVIYVPIENSNASKIVAPRSAIVAKKGGDPLVFHFEGNVYNSQSLQRYIDKLTSAAGRLATNYPTSVKAAFSPDEMLPVGIFDARLNCVIELSDPEALEKWSGEAQADIAGEKLRIGPLALTQANERVLSSAKYLGRSPREFAYRTLAGQLLVISAREPKNAEVYAVGAEWERR